MMHQKPKNKQVKKFEYENKQNYKGIQSCILDTYI